jgi:hypothetical protein
MPGTGPAGALPTPAAEARDGVAAVERPEDAGTGGDAAGGGDAETDGKTDGEGGPAVGLAGGTPTAAVA